MKIKFTDWKYIECDSFYNDEDEELEISVNEGDWYFEVDGKKYYWCVRREEYFDEDGDGKGDGYWVRDMNDNRKVLCDSRWIYWGDSSKSVISDGSFSEKFNDEMSVKEFILKVSEYLSENVKVGEYDNVEIFYVEEMDYSGKEKLIGLEFEI